jgi:broad specificity phosphatase PhoE
LSELARGNYEGQPEASAQQYLSAPMEWLNGDRDARIPGSIDGNEFDARFDDAVEAIYDGGDVKPVAFSHSAATIIWGLDECEESRQVAGR